MDKERQSTSDVLESVVVQGVRDTITLFEIKRILHERGFALLLLLFSLPLSIPLPVPPGYTTILSLPILFFSIQITLGCDSPWLPKFLENKAIKRKSLAFLIEKTVPILRKVEKFTRPRFPVLNNAFGEKIYGIISFICAVSIAIPLPLTNFIPAGGIALMSLGMLNKDGVISILGIVVSFTGIFISTLVIILGHKVVVELLSLLGFKI
ncbi:exopolysaccharide synthesis, ExoD family protein [Neorickettsia helminthoeca str. Oregon]|uniref:Exopolysaccharide synthesis, ExoD family protein n=1 Tax=Neorickettsia helminthoeca str. Oregon TaxID=1286528 RepID=X5GVR5_9RICK|nr:exopolysaccharide biosynthesis protein [Neorickettsia helminthoeca]AHX11157.1 exopolysaccharide synthesis, ExoD family protein [Neorickettsia helminthoeca str. Oregon]